MCDGYVNLELKIQDLQSELARTSAQLTTAREGLSSSYSLGSRQVEGERAQNFPAQLDRRGTSAQARVHRHDGIDGASEDTGSPYDPSCRRSPPCTEARRNPHNPSSEAYASDDRLRRIMRERGYCIPSGVACLAYARNVQFDILGNCGGLCGDHGQCFVCPGGLDTSGNCGNCRTYRGLPKLPNPWRQARPTHGRSHGGGGQHRYGLDSRGDEARLDGDGAT